MGSFSPDESNDTPGRSNTGIIVDPTAGICDFDNDADCDLADIDSLTAVGNLVVGVIEGFDPKFDLTNDNLVNEADLSEWLLLAGQENGFAGPLLRGDANLDGTINPADLNVVGINWLQNAQFSGGDFNGDGIVDPADLNFLGIGWLNVVPPAVANAAAVPEPSVCWSLPWFAALALVIRRRRVAAVAL